MLSNSYTNDKYSANTTSVFVPTTHRREIEQIIEYQNTQQSITNGEFICAIETAFSFSCADDIKNYDVLLVTIQESAYKRVARQLFDTNTLLVLLLDTSNPVKDDDVYLKAACVTQELGNIWFNRDWLLPVPFEVHSAAKEYTDDYTNLLYIKPVGSSTNLWEACFQKDDGETINITYSSQTETINKVVEHMLQSSTKGVIRQNW